MNNLLPYYRLVETRISASEKDLPVSNGCSFCDSILFIMAKYKKRKNKLCTKGKLDEWTIQGDIKTNYKHCRHLRPGCGFRLEMGKNLDIQRNFCAIPSLSPQKPQCSVGEGSLGQPLIWFLSLIFIRGNFYIT